MGINIEELLGSIVQSGMSKSSTDRMRNSAGGGGLLDSLAGMLGGGSGQTSQGSQGGGILGSLGDLLGGGSSQTSPMSQGSQGGGLLGGVLGNILNEAGKAVGGNKNLALGGLGALVGAIFGKKKGLGGALSGGLMALLGAMAFQALKGKLGGQAKVPLGLAAPQNRGEKKELQRNSELVLKAMINAAKADNKLDEGEVQRILGQAKETGVNKKSLAYLMDEMKKPMETEGLIAAAQGQLELAAQLYAASLLAIEVDTPAEKKYLEDLAKGLGLDADVTRSIKQAVGMQPA